MTLPSFLGRHDPGCGTQLPFPPTEHYITPSSNTYHAALLAPQLPSPTTGCSRFWSPLSCKTSPENKALCSAIFDRHAHVMSSRWGSISAPRWNWHNWHNWHLLRPITRERSPPPKGQIARQFFPTAAAQDFDFCSGNPTFQIALPGRPPRAWKSLSLAVSPWCHVFSSYPCNSASE